jgi:hypothetical protein
MSYSALCSLFFNSDSGKGIGKRSQATFPALNILRLRDESTEDSDNLLAPDVLAQEIVYDMEAALEQFREIATDLSGEKSSKRLREESDSV